MTNQMLQYLGQWVDESGKIIEIRENGGETVVDFFTNPNCSVERILLGGKKVQSLGMSTYIDELFLVVELGDEGVGATLQLEHKRIKEKDALIPTVIHGLHGDFEDDFGVPWVFPLSVYYKRSI